MYQNFQNLRKNRSTQLIVTCLLKKFGTISTGKSNLFFKSFSLFSYWIFNFYSSNSIKFCENTYSQRERRIGLPKLKQFLFCETIVLDFHLLISTSQIYFVKFLFRGVPRAAFRDIVWQPNKSTTHSSFSLTWCNLRVLIATCLLLPSTAPRRSQSSASGWPSANLWSRHKHDHQDRRRHPPRQTCHAHARTAPTITSPSRHTYHPTHANIRIAAVS